MCSKSSMGIFISIHTLCEEGDDCFCMTLSKTYLFQSTPSVKRATVQMCSKSSMGIFISIHTLCEEGDMILFLLTAGEGISIHTLCEEGDRIDKLKLDFFTNFNPHPLWRGRLVPHSDNDITIKFQSTPSVKRATRVFPDLCASYDISIHTLCEEGDQMKVNVQQFFLIFQSTPSVKRATFSRV